jgi:hypothetical protein
LKSAWSTTSGAPTETIRFQRALASARRASAESVASRRGSWKKRSAQV